MLRTLRFTSLERRPTRRLFVGRRQPAVGKKRQAGIFEVFDAETAHQIECALFLVDAGTVWSQLYG